MKPAGESWNLFPLGQLVATPAALAALERNRRNPLEYVLRHARLEQGILCAADHRENRRAAKNGSRILSAFALPDTTKLWVITEADRSVTTVLLPEEY